jgi:hypothetical protein
LNPKILSIIEFKEKKRPLGYSKDYRSSKLILIINII